MDRLEASVVGNLLMYPLNADLVMSFIKPEEFQKPQCGEIYQAILKRENKGELFDERLIYNDLKCVNSIGLNIANVLGEACLSPMIKAYILQIKDRNYKEGFYHKIDQIKGETFDDIQQKVQEYFSQRETLVPEATTQKTISDALASLLKKDDHISTGIFSLDKIIRGLGKGNVIVIGGATSHGKSALAMNFLNTVLLEQKKALYISQELSLSQIIARLLSLGAKKPIENLSEKELIEQANVLYEQEAYLSLRTLKPGTWYELKKQISGFKPDVIFVDHLQLMLQEDHSQNRHQFLSGLCAQIQTYAITTETCFVLLSQFNRRIDEDRRPHLSHLRDSGGIGESADQAILVYWPYKEDYSKPMNLYEITVTKNRHGPTGKIQCHFDPTIGLIRETNECFASYEN